MPACGAVSSRSSAVPSGESPPIGAGYPERVCGFAAPRRTGLPQVAARYQTATTIARMPIEAARPMTPSPTRGACCRWARSLPPAARRGRRGARHRSRGSGALRVIRSWRCGFYVLPSGLRTRRSASSICVLPVSASMRSMSSRIPPHECSAQLRLTMARSRTTPKTSRSCSPTTTRWSAAGCDCCSTPRRGCSVVAEAGNTDDAVRLTRRTVPACSCWTSTCRAARARRASTRCPISARRRRRPVSSC